MIPGAPHLRLHECPFGSLLSENSWEHAPRLDMDQRHVRGLIDLWADGADITYAKPLASGGHNTNYVVALDGHSHRYLMRVHAPDTEDWTKEVGLQARLGPHIPMPRVAYQGRDVPIVVFEYVEGVSLLQHMAAGHVPSKSIAQAIGASLAAIHAHTYLHIGSLADDLSLIDAFPPFETWIELFLTDTAQTRLGLELVARYRAYADGLQEELHEIASWVALVHGDYRPTNLIVRDDELVAVIDWEFAMADHPFSDLGQIIRHDWMSDELESEFLAAYHANGNMQLPRS